ncbi:hypothetical protein [Epilithonimonas arachidiradicis]|uniref:Uncharacterized protein n=1 Tax=Epilithonimonas arachidiradicis TaxID=1617282 RepID=A0A420CY72_9FLAO|nr:hypothetical protein [Epilithonimonas arachidiradicis]RKE83166.1 hypothetical protein BXY58_2718 [Epilithonimonas arachidiradicis]GGG65436.1 hypothetical protein GCM10007332_29920 [Epilithonimonas arachidiradicis]
MKNSIKIILAAFAMTMVSCVAATDSYSYNDPYSMGYSDGYRDGYYQSPDGYWYAPNVVYLDYNNNYYRNGALYKSNSRLRNNIVISPKRNSMHNENIRIQPTRSQRNTGMINTNQNNARTQPATGNRNNNRVEATRRSQNNIRTTPQKQVQPQIETRSTENSGRRK